MREFVFRVRPRSNAVADILAANPWTTIRSLSCHVTPDNIWRVAT